MGIADEVGEIGEIDDEVGEIGEIDDVVGEVVEMDEIVEVLELIVDKIGPNLNAVSPSPSTLGHST